MTATTIDRSAVTQQSDQFPMIETRKRNLNYFDKEIYVFSLVINKGSVDKSLSLDLLGLGEDQKKAIAKANGSRVTFRPVKIRAFESINEAAASLQASRQDIQDKMIFSGEYWFAKSADMPAINAICYGEYIRRKTRCNNRRETLQSLGIVNSVTSDELVNAGIQGKPDQYEKVIGVFRQVPIWREYISRQYDEDKSAAIADLRTVLDTIEDAYEWDKDSIVDNLVNSLPNREVVADQIGAKIGICVRIPSLKEQAREDADLARSLADIESAEAARLETRMARQLQDEYANNIRNSFRNAIATAEEEIYALINDSLGRITDVAAGNNLTDTTKNKLLENIARLQTLSSFGDGDSSLSSLISSVADISQDTVQRQSHRSALRDRLGEIRIQLDSNVEVEKVTGKGHKAIAQWMFS